MAVAVLLVWEGNVECADGGSFWLGRPRVTRDLILAKAILWDASGCIGLRHYSFAGVAITLLWSHGTR